jgi:hypothetical protein
MKEGKKNDKNKLRWDLLPIEAVEKIVEIVTHGFEKYGENNWKELENPEGRYYAALMRHLVAWRKGEKIDKDSGLSHLAHVGCNVFFLMWFEEQEAIESYIEDSIMRRNAEKMIIKHFDEDYNFIVPDNLVFYLASPVAEPLLKDLSLDKTLTRVAVGCIPLHFEFSYNSGDGKCIFNIAQKGHGIEIIR